MTAAGAWDEYLDALHTLARAPAAGDQREQQIESELAAARQAADGAVQDVAAAQEKLTEQIQKVRDAVTTAMAETALAGDGPVAPVVLPRPASIVEARGTLTRLERQLAEDERGLQAALARAADARRRAQLRLRITLVTAGVVVLALVLVVAMMLL